MIFRLIAVLIMLSFFVSCERTLSIEGPPYQRKAVLTGLLFPDSAITIRLTYTAPASTTTAYEAITNAQVQLFDDGQPSGVLANQGQGFYRTSVFPQAGHTYRVVAIIPGYGRLQAEDQMPAQPAGQLTIDNHAQGNPNNNPNFQLTFQPADASTPYWFSFYVTKQETIFSEGCTTFPGDPRPRPCTSRDVLYSQRNYTLTNSGYLDRFNSIYDGSSGAYIYSAFARFDPALVLGKPVDLVFTTYNQIADPKDRAKGEVNAVDLIATGPNYDRFLRSMLQAQMNQVTSSDNLLNNPFAEITPVYTNVAGGLGVLGAVSLQRFFY
jgi:hypothetical protein